MSGWPSELHPTRRRWLVVGWGGAALAVTGAHIAAAALMLAPSPPQPDQGIEVPIIIDVAPEMFAAPEDMVSDLPPDQFMQELPDAPISPEPPDEAELEEPQPEPIEQALMEPPPDTPPPMDAPAPVDMPPDEPPPERLESPTPPEVALPDPIPPPPPRPEVKTKTAQKPPAPQTSAPPKVDAPRAERAQAPTAAVGTTADPRQIQRWIDRANGIVARHMKRWRNPGKTITILMMVTYNGSGQVTGVSLRGSTGDPAVDQTLQAHVQRMPNLPPPPSGQGNTVRVPLELVRR